MANKDANREGGNIWPEGPEATLMFQAVVHFHRMDIERMLEAFPYDEYDIKPSLALENSIVDAVNKARRKVAWNKRKVVIRKAVAVAAIVILCILSTPTVMFAASSDFRDTVYNYIVDWRQGHANVNIDAELPPEHTFPKYYVPTFIPDGLVLENYSNNDAVFELYYSDGEQYFYFASCHISTGATMDTETAAYDFGYKINGLPAIVKENRGIITIVWEDNVTSFQLETNFQFETALEIAASYTLQEKFL